MEMLKFGPLYGSQTEAMYVPQLIRLKENLVVAAFRLMKLLPARYVVMKAYREGRIDPKLGIVETSSGTYALGLGMICAELKLPFHIVSDPAMDETLRRRLEDLGGHITIVSDDQSGAKLQTQRLAVVHEHLERYPGTFWPCQYHNPENREGYRIFADQLRHHLGDNFTLVGTAGSGGSTTGTVEFLREHNPDIDLVGIDTFGSALFGLPLGPRMLRGLGNSLLPENLRQELYDEVHWVTAAEAFYHTRRLHRETAQFMGPTSGAAYQVADWLAARSPERTFVFIGADEGNRYADTVYNDAWLREQGLFLSEPAAEPMTAETLQDVTPPWARMIWGRRSYEEVAGPRPQNPKGA